MWYTATAKKSLKQHFPSIREGEKLHFRMDETNYITLRYIFEQHKITKKEIHEFLNTNEVDNFIGVKPEMEYSLETNYQRILKNKPIKEYKPHKKKSK